MSRYDPKNRGVILVNHRPDVSRQDEKGNPVEMNRRASHHPDVSHFPPESQVANQVSHRRVGKGRCAPKSQVANRVDHRPVGKENRIGKTRRANRRPDVSHFPP